MNGEKSIDVVIPFSIHVMFTGWFGYWMIDNGFKGVELLAVNTDVIDEKQDISQSQKPTFNEQVLTKTKSLPMLKYWWQRASAKEKADFILYTKGQK